MEDRYDFEQRLLEEVDGAAQVITRVGARFPMDVRREDTKDTEFTDVSRKVRKFVKDRFGERAVARIFIRPGASAKPANEDFGVNVKCELPPEKPELPTTKRCLTADELSGFLHRFLFLTRYRGHEFSWENREGDENIIIPAGTKISINDKSDKSKTLEEVNLTLDEAMSLASFYNNLPFMFLKAGYPRIVAKTIYARINNLKIDDDKVKRAFAGK